MRSAGYFFIFLAISGCIFGPVGTSIKALKRLRQGDIVKTQQLLNKGLEKDSLNPALLYAKSTYLVSYKTHELYDSAYFYVLKAQRYYDSLDEKSKDQHLKHSFSPAALQALKEEIDSLSFMHYELVNSEEGFNAFLRKYPTARQKQLAITKRNALAYASAKNENTYQSYKDFIDKYPDAVQVPEARKRYEKLYYDKFTADGKVNSFIRFLKNHPETPYRKEAESKIFEVITAEHTVGGYAQFLFKYPKSHLTKKAIDFAFHAPDKEGQGFPDRFMNDSLRNIQELNQYELIPVLEEKVFGFMNLKGQMIIQPQYDFIDPDYTCGATRDDVLRVNHQLIGRNGAVVSKYEFEQQEDLGSGLLKVLQDGRWGVLHKSGRWVCNPDYSEIKFFYGHILALKKGREWELRTVSGRKIVSDQWNDLFLLDKFLMLEKNEKYEVKLEKQLLSAVDNEPLAFNYVYDDYELLEDGNIWLAGKAGEGVFDSQLQAVIPQDNQKIKPLSHGFLITRNGRSTWLDASYKAVTSKLHDIMQNESFLVGLEDTTANIIDLNLQAVYKQRALSVRVLGNQFAIVDQGDSLKVFFRDSIRSAFPSTVHFEVVKGDSQTEYLLVKLKDDQHILLSDKGKEITRAKAPNWTPIGDEYLIITEKNNKGLISSRNGKELLKIEYDAIGNYNQGNVSLLKNKKFGLYNVNREVLFPPSYDRNIDQYTDSIYLLQKEGKWFLAYSEKNKINKSGFDQITYWNDTSALVKQDKSWQFFNLVDKKLSSLNFRSFNFKKLANEELLAVVLTDEGYGVLSNKKGELVPGTYNDVIILDAVDKPVILTEKHIKEAAFYVIIYYDYEGNIIRKQALEAADYEKIYCQQ